MVKKAVVLGSALFSCIFGLSLLANRSFIKSLLLGTIAFPATYAMVRCDQKLNLLYPSTTKEQKTTLTRDIAIFWDYESVKLTAPDVPSTLAETLESILLYFHAQGKPRIQKAYANWQLENPFIANALYGGGFEDVHMSDSQKEGIGVQISCDCLDTVRRYPQIDHFLLVVSKPSYLGLVDLLKQMGKQVTLIARKDSVDQHLRRRVNKFVSFQQLLSCYHTPRLDLFASMDSVKSFIQF